MDEFRTLAERIQKTGTAETLTVRDLLRCFGQERRGKHVAASVRSALRKHKLETFPDFEVVHIDTPVSLRPKKRKDTKEKEQVHVGASEVATMIPDEGREVVLTIGQIEQANKPPVRVSRQDTVVRAITLMMQHGSTHLAVMSGDRKVDGVISWQTVGKARAAQRPSETVEHHMEPVRVVDVDTALFEAVRDIIESEVVLVRAKDQTICGVVTARDIAKQFVTLSEPFLFLEQIENHLRAILENAKISHEDVKQLVNPADTERIAKVKNVDDLSFGEISRGFARPEVWQKLRIALDRNAFCEGLEQIRAIRNKVMHFHPDGISPEDREILRKSRQMLQVL
jgi:CBS domain-containing protein